MSSNVESIVDMVGKNGITSVLFYSVVDSPFDRLVEVEVNGEKMSEVHPPHETEEKPFDFLAGKLIANLAENGKIAPDIKVKIRPFFSIGKFDVSIETEVELKWLDGSFVDAFGSGMRAYWSARSQARSAFPVSDARKVIIEVSGCVSEVYFLCQNNDYSFSLTMGNYDHVDEICRLENEAIVAAVGNSISSIASQYELNVP